MEHTKETPRPEKARTVGLQQAEYLLSVTRLGQLPADSGAEVAMAGRSNVGKSSVLNRVCQQRTLARVSRTPGRTQALNFFTLGSPKQRLVDLPGYGYAKVPEAMRAQWGELLSQYLRSRQSLMGLILVMDIRHPLMPFDCDLLRFAAHCQRPVHVLLKRPINCRVGQQGRPCSGCCAREKWQGVQHNCSPRKRAKGSRSYRAD